MLTKIIRVELKRSPYNIFIGQDIISRLGGQLKKLNIGKDAYIITNSLLKNKYGKILNSALAREGLSVRFKLIADTERSKSLETISRLLEDITSYDRKKQLFIIAFGGGVIGDVSGFVASVYRRGIPYVQVPTTLLAQVDSSIGGKTGFDLREAKNIVGTFYQPQAVFCDTNLLKTLDQRQLRSGLSEVIKYAIIKDPALFHYLQTNHKKIFSFQDAALDFVVSRCVYIKAKIIQQDERETRGRRTVLNFGHTLGHAIETAGDYRRYSHGEAVALGMLVVSDISQRLGLLKRKTAERIENIIAAVGLPVKIRKISLRQIIKAHYHDKKFRGLINRLVLIRGIGKTKIVENIPLEIIKDVLRKRGV